MAGHSTGFIHIKCSTSRSETPPPPQISSEISPIRTTLARPQQARVHISRLHLHPLLPVPSRVLPLHPRPKHQSDDDASPRCTRGGNKRGDVLWRVLHPERAGRQHTGEVAETDKDPRCGGARVLREVVVVVPRVYQTRGDVSAGG